MLVGLVGFINNGKGTAGEILEKEYGFKPISFAGPLKDATANIFGWPRHLLEGDTDESRAFREKPDLYWSQIMGRDFTPREALQKVGTEGCRNSIHKDIWIHALVRRMSSRNVITDVRFYNEMKFIHENDGIIIQIQRGPLPEWWEAARLANSNPNEQLHAMDIMKQTGVHNSEWNWIGGPIDYVIQNDGTLDDLKNNLYNILKMKFGAI